MMRTSLAALASLALLQGALGADILSTNGFTNCNNGTSTIQVNNLDISFDKSTNKIVFDVSGSSSEEQEITATLIVSAYGVEVYNQEFDPCDESTKVDQLCPVPAGTFAAKGTQEIPSEYVSQIPSIAYSVPDLDGNAQMILKAKDGQQVACVESGVSNGKTLEVAAVSYVAAGIAAAALGLSLLGAAAAGGQPGASHSSPGFSEVMWWFQGMAMNGMHSVEYPSIYRSFSKNFAFSTGLVPWGGLQTSIDNFRKSTGGNLTDNSYTYLKNTTLVFQDGSSSSATTSIARRALDLLVRQANGIETNINGTSSGSSNDTTSTGSKESRLVEGIQGYVEQLTIPEANTFMTVLLVFAILVAVIVVGILLFKVILEAWSLFGSFPKSLTTFRKEYWRVMAQSITTLVMLLYGVWTLYCIFQFTHGDSWAAKTLAGVTLGLFTALLAFYTWKIWSVAHKLKKLEGDSRALYENKETWKKYKLFYENYKKQYWWLFMPFIVYMFAKGCVLAAGDGHGLVQTIGQLTIEALMLILLLWNRPYDRKSGNWINIIIQIVRVLSVVCILVFVQELGIAKTTQTVTGVVLIAVQSALTGILAILILVNSLISCFKENPHRKRRKAAEKAQSRDLEGDTFLLETRLGPKHQKDLSGSTLDYERERAQAASKFGLPRRDSQDHLMSSAASMGASGTTKNGYRSVSQGRSEGESPPLVGRKPKLPSVDFSQYRGRQL